MKFAIRTLFALVVLAATAPFADAAPVTWKIDSTHTEASFQVRHFFSKVRGVFHAVEGTIVFDESDFSLIKVDAVAKVASVDTGNERRDGHLQTADFFDAEKNPTLSFKSTSVKPVAKDKFKITGDLTMRGVTKQVTFDAQFLGAGEISIDGKARGSKAGFAATTTVNRKDFGINWNKTLDNGGTVLEDSVTIVLNVEADKSN